jgi:hypothetical protein
LLSDMCATTVHSEIIFEDFFKLITEQPVGAFECQQTFVSELKERLEGGVLARAREIRKQVLDYRFPSSACSKA